jgi:signal transduction histidine kinase
LVWRELMLGKRHPLGWRLRLLVLLVLLGCVGVFWLARVLAAAPQVNASWQVHEQGQLELVASSEPVLFAYQGQLLEWVGVGQWIGSAVSLQRSARWTVDDEQRLRQQALLEKMSAIQATSVTLGFANGTSVTVAPRALGVAGLPAMFWALVMLAWVMYAVSVVVMLARPALKNLLYAVMGGCQSVNLLLMAIEQTQPLGLPVLWAQAQLSWGRVSLDLLTAAAMVHAVCLHPRRLPAAPWVAGFVWATYLALTLLLAGGQLPHAWWWVQGSVLALSLLALVLLSRSYRTEPNPFALMARRLGAVLVLTWLILTLAVAVVSEIPHVPSHYVQTATTVWYVFFTGVLALLPFLVRSQHFIREFALLALISTVATVLDLVFVAVFSWDAVASLSLSLLVSLALYSAARQWVLNRVLGNNVLSTERMFEQLYLTARKVEAHPERIADLLGQLLCTLFEPLEHRAVEGRSPATRISGDGSCMRVPVPALNDKARGQPRTLVLRFARRGRSLFATEDARLADRIVEQLGRAVRFDRAVEQGRTEERLRLAQDLHDDIGARLLTLMYKAQSPEMEDYVRHTLQDLKTLTRGLAAFDHSLSHAAAEWKTDIAHRLKAAGIELKWSLEFDEDMALTVVQWSALTRVMRELVSNVIAHAQARHLHLDFKLQHGRIDLALTDDGIGANPQTWSHGLGLGGVRKRVKQLGGEVHWRLAQPHGISCQVVIRALGGSEGL